MATSTDLLNQIALRQRSPDFSAFGLHLPNPDPILKKMGRDIQVYRELRGDAHVGGCIRRRKAAVKGLEWRIERADASARAAKRIEGLFGRLDLDRLIAEILDALLFGYAPLEIMWQSGPDGLLPSQIIGKPAEWFLFSPDAELRFRSREHLMDGEPLPARKFLCPTQDASYANPYGQPDLGMCFWPTTFKRGGLRHWVKFAEKYGMPWAIGKQPRGTQPAETEAFLDQLEAMIEDAVAVIPDDASVELVENKGGAGAADAYEKLLMYCRSEIAVALLGGNQSTEKDSTHASASAGLEVAADLRDGDARLVEATLNQLIRWVVDLNDGEGVAAPKFELFEQEEVNEVQAKRDLLLTQAGARLSPHYWKRTYGLEEADLLPEAAVAPASSRLSTDAGEVSEGAGMKTPAFPTYSARHAQATPDQDAADLLAAHLAAAAAPEDRLASIQAMLDSADSLEEFRARLLAAYPTLDRAGMTAALAQAFQVAELQGISEVVDETGVAP